MSELSKSERIRKAREKWEKRGQDRPVQITAPTSDHVVGWDWPKVSDLTLAEFDDFDLED